MINLARSTHRRRHMEEQLAGQDLEHEFVAAVDGQSLRPEERSAPHLPAGIEGCALSHVEAYRRVCADGEAMGLVLEDDAVLPARLGDLLNALEPHLTRAEVALLHYLSVNPCPLTLCDAVEVVDGARLLYPLNAGQLKSVAAYVITREACERMINFALPIHTWPDAFNEFARDDVYERVRCVFPRPVVVETDFKSTVGYADGLLATVVPKRRVLGDVPGGSAVSATFPSLITQWGRSSLCNVPAGGGWGGALRRGGCQALGRTHRRAVVTRRRRGDRTIACNRHQRWAG